VVRSPYWVVCMVVSVVEGVGYDRATYVFDLDVSRSQFWCGGGAAEDGPQSRMSEGWACDIAFLNLSTSVLSHTTTSLAETRTLPSTQSAICAAVDWSTLGG